MSSLHDIKVGVSAKLKEAECIVLSLLSNRRGVVAAALNDQAVIFHALLAYGCCVVAALLVDIGMIFFSFSFSLSPL